MTISNHQLHKNPASLKKRGLHGNIKGGDSSGLAVKLVYCLMKKKQYISVWRRGCYPKNKLIEVNLY